MIDASKSQNVPVPCYIFWVSLEIVAYLTAAGEKMAQGGKQGSVQKLSALIFIAWLFWADYKVVA